MRRVGFGSGLVVAAVVAAWALDGPVARASGAGSGRIFVHVANPSWQSSFGSMDDAYVDDVSGGMMVQGQTLPSRPGMQQLSTPSFITPLVIKSDEAKPMLVKTAARFLASPSTAPLDLDVKWLKDSMAGTTRVDQEVGYVAAVVNRVDFPGNHGTLAERGAFVLTATIARSASQTVPSQRIPFPTDSLPRGIHLNELVWVLKVEGLPNVNNGLKSGGSPLTYDGFSLSPTAGGGGGLALTVHGALAECDLAKWTQAHPNGGSASIEWRTNPTGSASGTTYFIIGLTGVTLSGSTNDTPKVAGTAPTTFTARLSAQHVTFTNNL